MEVRGVGIDIVEVARIENMVGEWGSEFLDRVFTERELEYCRGNRRQYEHLAGRFAAKEAVIKAFGERLPWKSIEVISDRGGRPVALISSDSEDVSREKLHVSITHLEEFALAIALLES